MLAHPLTLAAGPHATAVRRCADGSGLFRVVRAADGRVGAGSAGAQSRGDSADPHSPVRTRTAHRRRAEDDPERGVHARPRRSAPVCDRSADHHDGGLVGLCGDSVRQRPAGPARARPERPDAAARGAAVGCRPGVRLCGVEHRRVRSHPGRMGQQQQVQFSGGTAFQCPDDFVRATHGPGPVGRRLGQQFVAAG